MSEMAQLLAQTDVLLLAFSVLIFDMPRYTLSLLSLALFGARRRGSGRSSIRASVSVIIPTFNGGTGLDRSIVSLQRQSLRPVEIIIVDDGSTDKTRFFAERARAQGLADTVICHGTRCGRSAAINAGARFATGDLILTVDADTVFEPTAIARLAAVFADPRVGGASCNIAIRNARNSIWTGLQSVEYLMSITAGRSVLDAAGAIACLSGACSMYRREVFLRQGGLDVGPGEDLEYTLRLAPPGLSHPLCSGRFGGNGRAGQRHRPSAPARTLGSRRLANPVHDVWGVRLLPSARASSGYDPETGFYCFRSRSHPHTAILSGIRHIAVRRRCRTFPCLRLCAPPRFFHFQHGARVRHVQSVRRVVRSGRGADLSALSGRLSEVRSVLLILRRNNLREFAA